MRVLPIATCVRMVVISVILGITGNAWGLAGAAYSEVGTTAEPKISHQRDS